MKFSQRLSPLIKESRNLVDLFLVTFFKQRLVFKNSNLTLKITCQEVKSAILLNLKKHKLQLLLKSSSKDNKIRKKMVMITLWTKSR
jgi:hypothetical protein